jgi:hypothetical protein
VKASSLSAELCRWDGNRWWRRQGQCGGGEYKVEFETISVNEYEKKYEEQQIKYLKKTCAEPVEARLPSWASNSSPPNQLAWMSKRRPHMEDALFVFNGLREISDFLWAILALGANLHEKACLRRISGGPWWPSF